ncbi:MAG: hypothetical protein V1789_05165 [PVC group bacterium]
MKRTILLSGNEAVARGAWEAGVILGTGYPGTPSSEILENLNRSPPLERRALDLSGRSRIGIIKNGNGQGNPGRLRTK